MIALNKNPGQACRQLLTAFFTKSPNTRLQSKANCLLKMLLAQQIPMAGKPGGWAGGIIYAVANQGFLPCGVPGLLNQECEELFNVSMGTIYRRAWHIKRSLSL